MSPTTIIGLALLIIGGGLTYLGLYTGDTLFLLQSSLWHFFEHMQMLWDQTAQTPRIYLVSGGVIFLIGLLLLLKPRSRKEHANEYF
ncbi:MAG: hypothetical protein ABIQ54_04355 [Gammaproteobacteria bacterium]